MELRCAGKLHGVVVGGASGILEVKCDSRFCRVDGRAIVLHYFKLSSGRYTTRRFKDPGREGGKRDGTYNDSTAVRAS